MKQIPALGRAFLALGFFALARPAPAVVREVGNGGDTISIEFVRVAYDVLTILDSNPAYLREIDRDRLAQVMSRMNVDAEDEILLRDPVTGKLQPKDATNHPEMSPPQIYVSRKFWRDPRVGYTSRLALALHEVLGLLGMDLERYDFTRGFLEADLARLSETKALEPIELYTYRVQGRAGLDRGEVTRLCRQYRERYGQTYYQVLCHVHERGWSEVETSTAWRYQAVVLGYAVSSGTSSSSSYGSSSGSAGVDVSLTRSSFSRRGYQRVGAAASAYASRSAEWGSSSSSSYYSSRPVWTWELVPETVYNTRDYSVYGVSIVGVGDRRYLPWKSAFRSDYQVGGIVSRRFQDEGDARLACLGRLRDFRLGPDGDLFDKGRCRVFETGEDSGPYAYEIQTQNPGLIVAP